MEKQPIPTLKQINQSLIGIFNTLAIDKKVKVFVTFCKTKTIIQCGGSTYEIFDTASLNSFKNIIKGITK